MAEDRNPQLDRAIRRAVESTARIRRPADWTSADYRNFERALRDNGYEVRKIAEQSGG